MNITLNESIKRLRKARGVTQEVLADYLGVSFQSVSKWERGEAYPDITLLPQIAEYFAVSVDQLLGIGERRKDMFKLRFPEPIVFVNSLADTAEWYKANLGWKGPRPEDMAECNAYGHMMIELDSDYENGFGIHFMCEPTRATGGRGSAFIFVENLVSLREDILARGCESVTEIFDQGWGTNLFFVTDLNGFELRFAEWKCEG
ncbi:MAG: helix-turn-helix domain-containing protein [Oscillospiraceae bacterium]|nr:helix-turn-helix domain-containing protein [Oscillospiraceae bacterium]